MKALETSLYQAAALTFEGLAFAFPTGELSEEEARARLEAAVRVDFRGSFGGYLVLGVSGGILRQLTENMLGNEQMVTDRLQGDALGELGNVICGNVLDLIGGPESRFRLEAPQPAEPGEFAPPPDCPSAAVRIGLEGGRADILLVLERSAAALVGVERS